MRHPRSAVLFTLMSTLAAAVAVALGTVVPVSNVADERPVLEPAALRASSQTALASFEENRGQHDPRVRFMARGANFSVYLTPAEAVYVLPVSTAPPAERTNFALRMAMAGARADAPLSGEAPQTRRVNYLRGNDPSAWVSDAPTFGRVRQHDVYDGVDVVWYANDAGTLEYDFEVAPARNPQAIEIAIDGASRVEIAEDGELWMHTDAGVLKQARPIAYQERDGARVEISSAYEIRDGGRVGFRLGDYDDSRALVIDPNLSQLAFSTYLGGSGTEQLTGLAVDAAGNVYVTGDTMSTNFPTVAGSFDVSANGGSTDVFVTKLNAAATTALYSTYLGGSGSDREGKIAVDGSGRAYVVGYTNSTNFPITAGAFDTTYDLPASDNGFVFQLTASGAALGYSTFLGNQWSYGRDVAVDAAGNAYVLGLSSGAAPVTAGALDTTYNGSYDYFVAKLNPTGTALVYATFLGGAREETWAAAIALAGTNAIIAGTSRSSDFPTTTTAFDQTYNGGDISDGDGVVVMLNASGTALIGSTFLGGSDGDEIRDVAFGTDAFVYVAGMTESINFPATTGAFDQTHNGGDADGFAARLNLNMSALSYSTFVGGAQGDGFHALALEPRVCIPGFPPCAAHHRMFAVGVTHSTNVPLTASAFDPSLTGPIYNSDGYVALLNAAGSAVDYGTYFGGSQEELAFAAALDAVSNLFIAGMVTLGGTGFPIAGDSVFQKAPGGGTWDGFVAKLGSYVVSGRIVSAAGLAVPGVTVTASQGFSGTTQTDAQGFYLFQTPSTGSYRITPSQQGFTFSPTFRDFTNPQSNRVANFTRQ